MERSKAKEAGRKKTIREKANALKDKPPRKAPTKEAIKQAGRYHAIETARKQLIEAQQAIAPDQEQQPNTAVDKVEDYAGSIVNEAVQLPVSTLERSGREAKKNAFHRETQKESATSPKKPSPKYLMRREAVKEYKRKYQAEKQNSFHHETQFEPDEAVKSAERTKEHMQHAYVREIREQTDYHTAEKDAVEQPFSRGSSAHNPKRREKIARAQHITSTATQPNPTQSTGQRQSKAAGMLATRQSKRSRPTQQKACLGKQQRQAATFSRNSVRRSQRQSPPAGKRCFMRPGRWCLLSFPLWSLWAWPLCLPAAAKDAAPMCPSAQR